MGEQESCHHEQQAHATARMAGEPDFKKMAGDIFRLAIKRKGGEAGFWEVVERLVEQELRAAYLLGHNPANSD